MSLPEKQKKEKRKNNQKSRKKKGNGDHVSQPKATGTKWGAVYSGRQEEGGFFQRDSMGKKEIKRVT